MFTLVVGSLFPNYFLMAKVQVKPVAFWQLETLLSGFVLAFDVEIHGLKLVTIMSKQPTLSLFHLVKMSHMFFLLICRGKLRLNLKFFRT